MRGLAEELIGDGSVEAQISLVDRMNLLIALSVAALLCLPVSIPNRFRCALEDLSRASCALLVLPVEVETLDLEERSLPLRWSMGCRWGGWRRERRDAILAREATKHDG